MSSMTNTLLARAILGLTAAAMLALGASRAVAAADPPDRVLQVDRYTSDKGRALGQKFQGPLRDLNAKVYHCMPWLEVKTEGIGFYKPKHLEGDARYLSVNVTVDQQPAPEFTRLPLQDRVSAMFSRYVPHLLRSMASGDLLKDPSLEGFTVIVSWLKAEPTSGQAPVFTTVSGRSAGSPCSMPFAIQLRIVCFSSSLSANAGNGWPGSLRQRFPPPA